NKSTKIDQYSDSLNLYDEAEKDVEKYKNNNINKSTLSLHISAYENSIESNGDNTVLTGKNAQKMQNSKHLFADSIIQNPFEFPRQQKEGKSVDPEMMQFKASQKLLNPNESLASNNGQVEANEKKLIASSGNPFDFPRQEDQDPQVPEISQFKSSQKLLNPNEEEFSLFANPNDPESGNTTFEELEALCEVADDFQESNMDLLPDSDDENALNDETFGGCGDVDQIPEDLSSFAALALKLEDIEDEQIRNNPSSSSSTTQKRPKDLGNPWTGMNAKASDDYQERAYKSQQEAVKATQSLWGQSPNASPRRDNFFSSSGYNRAPSPPKSASHALRSIPGGALTLDEIEHEQLMRTGAVHLGNTFPLTPGDRRTSINAPSSSHVANAIPHDLGNHSSDWVHPPLDDDHSKFSNQKKTFVTAEELERRLMEEFKEKKVHQQVNQNQHPPPPPLENDQGMNNMANMCPPGAKMPPMNPAQMAQMQQFFHWQQSMAAAAMASGAVPQNAMPPGFPPLMSPYGPPNPAMFAAMMASRMPFPPPPPGMPPMGPPPSGFGMPPQMNQRSQAGTPNNALHPQGATWASNSPMNRNTLSGVASPSGSTTSRRTRKEGMPSMRTITDFAVDPYAGFMSKKEREWLIKIQLIQCLGTGDKYNDDYYYTCWKKNNTLEKRPDSWKQPKIKSKYYNLEETYPSVYNPPTFSGVLGKPTNATTSFPRQCFKVLDIQPAEDDVESIVGSSSREINKRKLRTILLSIENGYMWQLECDDLLRKVPTVSADEAGDLFNEIHTKLNAIYTTTMDESHIPTTMVITKGRRLCIRILSLATSPLKAQILSNVFNTLRKYTRKVSIAPNNDFIQAALKTLVEIKENDLKEFFVKTDAERFQDTLVYSSFSQNLFTALLIACAKRAIHLEVIAPGSSIMKFLQSDRKMYNGLGAAYAEVFTSEDLSLLKKWLQKSLICSSGNVAGCFLVCLRDKNY
uniref:Uncharacterized protein n=1 Tax=Panagrolaimus sp. ES5 TaxID=591445 RepID=A0AC34GYG2_9BILA